MYDCEYHYSTDASSTGEIASSSCAISTTTPATIATTSDVAISPTLSAGDILISTLLVILIVIQICELIVAALSPIKVQRRFLGNNSRDGKEITEV